MSCYKTKEKRGPSQIGPLFRIAAIQTVDQRFLYDLQKNNKYTQQFNSSLLFINSIGTIGGDKNLQWYNIFGMIFALFNNHNYFNRFGLFVSDVSDHKISEPQSVVFSLIFMLSCGDSRPQVASGMWHVASAKWHFCHIKYAKRAERRCLPCCRLVVSACC